MLAMHVPDGVGVDEMACADSCSSECALIRLSALPSASAADPSTWWTLEVCAVIPAPHHPHASVISCLPSTVAGPRFAAFRDGALVLKVVVQLLAFDIRIADFAVQRSRQR